MSPFGAPYGRFEQLATILFVVAIGIAILVLNTIPGGQEDAHLIKIIVGLLLLPLLWMWFYTVRGYEIEGDRIKIKRLISPVNISLNNIVDIELREDFSVWDIVKIVGSGGAFGYIGYHKSKKVGTPIKTYMNRVSPLILIRTEKNTFLLSPDDTRSFIDSLKTRIGSH